jgi:hypothetical protein
LMNACGSPGATACAVLLPLLAACAEPDGRGATAMVRDSAGITIVENTSPEAAPVYAVSRPVFEVGVVEGAAEYELHDVTSVVRLSDGSVAVATGGSEIRWFDEAGVFRRRVGRAGDGPGEFRRIRYMRALPGDSLLAFDSNNRRVSVLAPDGGFVRSETIGPDDERSVTVAGALRDGTLLTRTVLETPRASTPLYRVRMGFAVIRDGAALPLATYLGQEAALHVEGSGGGIGSVFISVLPFARSAHATAGPYHFFIGSSDTWQIDVWDAVGRLVRVIRVAIPVAPVTDDVRHAYIAGELERMRRAAEERGQPFQEPAARQQLHEQPHAPALPAFGALLATADGGFWASDYTMPGAGPVQERWTIFDADGRLTAIIHLPTAFTPLHVDGTSVLGVFRDSLDVPYVHGYTVSEHERDGREDPERPIEAGSGR